VLDFPLAHGYFPLIIPERSLVMRPTGVVLIALYHFAGTLILITMAIAAVLGGDMLGSVFGGMNDAPIRGMKLGFALVILSDAFLLLSAVVSAMAGYGMWTLREWGRITAIGLAVLSLLFSLYALLIMGMHFIFGFGIYRLFRIVVSVMILWYLFKPETKALFHRTTSFTTGS
jgi:hypothetical protein